MCLVCVWSVPQSCPTLRDPMDHSPPVSSVYGIFLSQNTGVNCHFLLQGSFSTQGPNPLLLQLLYWQADFFFFLNQCITWEAQKDRYRASHMWRSLLHALETAMAPHSSVLAWRIPGTGEPGGLPSMGSHRVGHDWSDLAAAAAAACLLAKYLESTRIAPIAKIIPDLIHMILKTKKKKKTKNPKTS